MAFALKSATQSLVASGPSLLRRLFENVRFLCEFKRYVGGPSTSTVCLDLRAESLDDALEYAVGLYNEIASTVASGGAPVQATRYANNDEPRPKEYFRIFRSGPDLTPEQLKKQEEYTEMMVTKSKVYTASIAEEASADFEAHAAAAAEAREGSQLGVECSVCHQRFSTATVCKAHVSTVVSAGCSGESLSAYAPHLFVSDLLCVCYVWLCVPTLQHNKERNFPCQLCDQEYASKRNLKRHVLSQVSAGEAAMCACD